MRPGVQADQPHHRAVEGDRPVPPPVGGGVRSQVLDERACSRSSSGSSLNRCTTGSPRNTRTASASSPAGSRKTSRWVAKIGTLTRAPYGHDGGPPPLPGRARDHVHEQRDHAVVEAAVGVLAGGSWWGVG